MKQSRRWAAWLSALMLAAGLTVMPREGAAWTPYIDTVDPPVTEGDPDVPNTAPRPAIDPGWSFLMGRLRISYIPQTGFLILRANGLDATRGIRSTCRPTIRTRGTR